MHTHTHAHACMHTHIHIHTHIHKRARAHAHTHTRARALMSVHMLSNVVINLLLDIIVICVNTFLCICLTLNYHTFNLNFIYFTLMVCFKAN